MSRPYRVCTVCSARGKRVEAVNIATARDKMQWYECAEHDAFDHMREFQTGSRGERIHIEPLADWFKRLNLI